MSKSNKELIQRRLEKQKRTKFLMFARRIHNSHLEYHLRKNLLNKIENKEITSNEDKIVEYINNVLDSSLGYTSNKYFLDKIIYNQINMRELNNKINIEELKEEIKIRKNLLNTHLNYTLKNNLLNKINKNEITTNGDKIIEFLKIVLDSNLDITSQEQLLNKINNYEITTKEELKKEITEEEEKTNLRRAENRKDKRLEIYARNNYGNLSVLINDRINSGELKTENEVDCAIKKLKEKNEEQEKERKRKQDLVRNNEKLKNAKYNIGWWSYRR